MNASPHPHRKTHSPKSKNRTPQPTSGRDNHSPRYPCAHYSQTTPPQHAPYAPHRSEETTSPRPTQELQKRPPNGSFPNPATMTHIHPSLYPTSACPLCGAHANLAHIIWACPQDPFPEIPSEESPDSDLQARLVKRVEEVAGKPRPTATTGPPT
ncbi:hypothetical protein HPB47_003696 [Ixodes persulcatus]|uniref:Uncharacterized protein n=1 Tax=Ixodes persulcatus TaxID=34615 RepID=A0AC60PHQ8_IXOPE|nr:hypothetical protein HPB47_003696 [Ixodes persulcatus]